MYKGHECNCVVLHHNSEELHAKLKSLGFIDLKWTTCLQKEQILIASSYPHTVKKGGYQDKQEDVTYQGSFWNGGNPDYYHNKSNCIDCGDDEEKFLKYAERVIKETYLYFDENWNETEKPKWA